jgi:signal transduction histidine kinase
MESIELLLIVTIALQAFAAIVALSLVKHTKYYALWICYALSLGMLIAERYSQLMIIEGDRVSIHFQSWIGIGISISFLVCVICARLLVRHVDRMTLQRRMLENKLMTAVLRTEERSRADISRELHDGLGPLLSSAKMSLSAVSKEGMTEKDKATLRNTAMVIDEAIRSLREISNNLSPHVLNNFGLARGIRNFVDRVVALHGVNVRFNTTLRDERFDSNIEVIIYRVTCELINNSLKHSKCKQIEVALTVDNNRLILDYKDDGCGFSPESVADKGMGISNMGSRVSSLSGVFLLDSSVGKGMSAHAEVSLDGTKLTAPEHAKGRNKKMKLWKTKQSK